MAVRTVSNFSSAAGTKIASGPFPKKSYARFLDGAPSDPRGTYVAGVYTATTAEDPEAWDSGWQVPEPAADTVKVYLDMRPSSEGSDSNSGLTPLLAKASWAAAIALIDEGSADWLCIRRGSVLENITLSQLPSGRSNSEPILLTYYGNAGDRPKFVRSTGKYNFLSAKQNIRFVGLQFCSKYTDPYSPDFKLERLDYDGNEGHGNGFNFYHGSHANIWFIDCKVEYGEISIQSPGSGIAAATAGPFRLHRSIIVGAYSPASSYDNSARPSNMYVDKINGLYLTECTLDHGGWNPIVAGAGANMFNHNLYFQYDNIGDNMEMRDSLCMNASANGNQFRSGGLTENNFYFRNAISNMMGNSYTEPGNFHPLQDGTRCHMYNNVIHQGRTMRNGQAACVGANLCASALWGLDMVPNNNPGETSDYQMHGNIVSMLAPLSVDPTQATASKSAINGLQNLLDAGGVLSQNHYYKWNNLTQGTDQGYPDPERTLETYLASIGFSISAEDFCRTVIDRPLGAWNAAWAAPAINDYFRIGFGQTRISYSWP